MADELHRPGDALIERLAASRRHWESEGREGAPLVMPGSDLRRLDLREQVLAGAQLQGADLRGALLDSCVLVRAALDGARMAGSSLYAADAYRATFADAQLSGAQAPRSRWRRAALSRADLSGAHLDDADLTGAELLFARLDRASLIRADLRRAVLLGATFRDSDLDGADLEGAAVDARTLLGAKGVHAGEPVIGPQRTRRRRGHEERQFEERVRQALRESRLNVMWGFERGPDLIVVLEGDWYAAVEASTSYDQARLVRLAARTDVIVVPDHLAVRAAYDGVPTVKLNRAADAIRELEPSQLKPHAATALVLKQAPRLRPYLALAEHARADPSFLSRLSVYLDTDESLILTAADRAVADALPAHLGVAMTSRAVSWVEEHSEELITFLSQAARLSQGEGLNTKDATMTARQGRRLESDLARSIGLQA